MSLPKEFIESLRGIPGFSKESFEEVHDSGVINTSIRLNPFKPSLYDTDFLPGMDNHHPVLKNDQRIPWSRFGYYLESRPSFTFDPFFHAGGYYVQEASSMFLEQAIEQTTDITKDMKVLDLCASPGGKSTHLLSLLSKDSLLVSNELIRSRVHVLYDNLIKWGCSNYILTSNDAKGFQKLENFFDVIVVDAPCSGSGLFHKDPNALDEWSINNVTLCSQRQQRILADVLPALKKNGVLIYSTCSFSTDENESVSGWIQDELNLEYIPLKTEAYPGIVDSGMGYRFWPDRVKGEGFFTACFRKTKGKETDIRYPKGQKFRMLDKEIKLLERYIDTRNLVFLETGKKKCAFNESLIKELNLVVSAVKIRGYGTVVGEMVREKLIPDHALAMSASVNKEFPFFDLDYGQAIDFLKKKSFPASTGKKGWHLVKYKKAILGWINVVPGRINNYYPKELRILKD